MYETFYSYDKNDLVDIYNKKKPDAYETWTERNLETFEMMYVLRCYYNEGTE